ncbi:MAG: hypothetical protein JWP91_1196 [Fibrobacteres bacterium]|nr:hypothetical protein [Fibrobacterota bacterium]
MEIKQGIRIFERGSLILGIGLSAGLIFCLYEKAGFLRDAERLDGMVVDNRESWGSKGNTWNAVVEYANPEGGMERFESGVSSNPPAFAIGEKVTVLVSRDGSGRCIESLMELWFVPLLLGVFALAFGGPGLVMTVMRKRKGEFSKYVKAMGEEVSTSDVEVRINNQLSVNDRNPYYLYCKAVIDGETRIFKSGNIWEDPTAAVEGRSVKIHYLRNRPKKHLVDIGFLEEPSGEREGLGGGGAA